MDFSGEILSAGKPSSDWRFHRDILAARSEIGAVIHTHSRYATTLACVNLEIPPFHYIVEEMAADEVTGLREIQRAAKGV